MGEAFLLGHDLYVFKNVADYGPADFIVATPDLSTLTPIDVKVAITQDRNGSPNIYANPLTSAQRELGVQALWVTTSNDMIWPRTNTKTLDAILMATKYDTD